MNEFQLSLLKQLTPYIEINSYTMIWDQFNFLDV